MLWLNVSGLAAMSVCIASRSPLKSGVRTSTAQPGTCSLISRMVSAKMEDPPSFNSSRFTLVITACLRSIFFAASATRWGSSRASSVGLPVSTLQKAQRQVLRRSAVGGRGDGFVLPAVPHLEGSRAVLQHFQRDLSAGHSFSYPSRLRQYTTAPAEDRAVLSIAREGDVG